MKTLEEYLKEFDDRQFISHVAVKAFISQMYGELTERLPIMKMDEDDITSTPIFNLLNCYEVDASEIRNGMAYIGSNEAMELSKKIVRMWNKTIINSLKTDSTSSTEGKENK